MLLNTVGAVLASLPSVSPQSHNSTLFASLLWTHLATACAGRDLPPPQLQQLPLHVDRLEPRCRSSRAFRALWEEL